MKYILSPEQMRQADAAAINDFCIPSVVLMENAARSCAEYIIEIIGDKELKNPSLLFLCGSGNNGGDGYATARHLHENYRVRIFWIGDTEKMSPETLTNFLAAEKSTIPMVHIENPDDIDNTDFSADCIIDSLIGVGGSEQIRGIALDLIKKVKSQNSLKIAIDSPTGLNVESGIAHPDCFSADYTITMFAEKTGLLLNDGLNVSGQIFIANLGAPSTIVKNISKVFVYEKQDIPDEIPTRKRRTSKFDYGRVLILAGSTNFPGAAALCSNAAITSGAGLVNLFTTSLHPGILPDVIPFILPQTKSGSVSGKSLDVILKASENANVITIGPGLSDDQETVKLVKEIIKNLPEDKKIVIDADGLRAVDAVSKLNKNIVLTPHTGEFSRITCIPREDVEKHSFRLSKEWANKLNCIILLKHVPGIITDGELSYFNVNGNPGMAKGGSGDVLTGIISGLLARGLEPLKAASLGANIHASAGDLYTSQFSEETLTASGMIEMLKYIFPKRQI